MLIKTVTTVSATNSAGQVVEALPVRQAVDGETDIVGRPVTPVDVTEDARGVPVLFVTGKAVLNSAGQVVDTIAVVVSGGVVPEFIVTFDDPDGTEYILTFDDPDTNEYILTAEAA